MIIVTTVQELLNLRKNLSNTQRNSIGFVPTMGALHQGHFSLVKRAREENEFVCCSIFVNPTQFDNAEDLEKYPRNLDQDAQQLAKLGVDVIFAPQPSDVYSSKTMLQFSFGELEKVMEGKFRTGHFNGVATVVSKLFHYVNPTRAYFGQKDLQQVAIIKDLVNALSFDLDIVRCDIIREENGLAMSSRNQRLTEDQKTEALILHKTIESVKDNFLKNGSNQEALSLGKEYFETNSSLKLEYLELVNANTLQPLNNSDNKEIELAVCIAAYVGDVRLIDNVVFKR